LSGTIMSRRTGLRKRLAALATRSCFPPICVPQPSAPATKAIIATRCPRQARGGTPRRRGWLHRTTRSAQRANRRSCRKGPMPSGEGAVPRPETRRSGRHRPGRAAGRAAQGTCARARLGPAPHPACRSVIPEAYRPVRARKVRPCPAVAVLRASGAVAGHLKLRHKRQPGRSLPGVVRSGGPAGAHGRAGPRLDHRHMSLRRPAERRLKPGMPGHVHVDISGESFFDAGTEQRISR
jgi:hypothetical protein